MRSIITPSFWDPGRVLFAKAVTALVCFFVGLSFLLNSIRSGSIVNVALTIAVLGLCVYLSRTLWTTLQSKSDSPQSLPPRDIDKPWTYRRDWRPDVFHEEKVRVRLRAVFGSLFMGMGAAIALSSVYGRFFETWEFHPHMILVWGAPIAAVAFLWMGLREPIRQYRYGRTALRMLTKPGVMGQRLNAIFHTSLRPEDIPEEGLRAEIRCYERSITYVRSQNGNRGRKVVRKTRWHTERRVRGREGEDGLDVPVSFKLPEDLPESTPRQKDDRIVWQLRLWAPVPGVDYDVSFEVPVFSPDREALPAAGPKGNDETEDIVLWTRSTDEEAQTGEQDARDWKSAMKAEGNPFAHLDVFSEMDAPTSDGIHMTRSGTGIRFDFEAGRHGKAVLILAGMALPFVGFAALFLSEWGYFVMNTMGLGAALLAGLLLGWALKMYTEETHLSVQNGTITAETTSLLSSSTRQHPVQTLLDVQARRSGKNRRGDMYSLDLRLTRSEVVEDARRAVGAAEAVLPLLRIGGLMHTAHDPDGPTGGVSDLTKQVRAAVLNEAQWVTVAHVPDKTEGDWIAAQILAHADRQLQFT
jgi:branched-subunit amino acid transport protein AzlD